MHAINLGREYIAPILALISFFPIYFWTYIFSLPGDVQRLLDGSFYTDIASELVMTCAACGLIARVGAYQTIPIFKRIVKFSDREPRFAWAKIIQKCFISIGPYLLNDVLVTLTILLALITLYFTGIFGIIFMLLYMGTLLAAFGALNKTEIMLGGNMDIEATGDFRLAITVLSTTSIKALVTRHLSFLSMAILTLPLCMGLARFVALIDNDDVSLSVNSNVVQSKLLASTNAGLLFVASADAKVLRLLARRPTDYFLLMPNGKVLCFGERNKNCSP